MKKKKLTKEPIGIIRGKTLITKAKGKLNRNDGIVKSGTGYHQSPTQYSRKSKKNQQLKNSLKDYGSMAADFLCV